MRISISATHQIKSCSF